MKHRISGLCLAVIPLAALVASACGGSDSATGSAGNNSGGDAATAASAGVSSAGTSFAGASEQAGTSGYGGSGSDSVAGAGGEAGTTSDEAAGQTGVYLGPTVGRAKTFAALAYSSITTANISTVHGEIGVSAGAISNITGFDAPANAKYGIDSLAPNSHRTMLAQQDVTALVGNIMPRACDADYTNVVGGLTGEITLHPGVTCMNSFSADVLVNGKVTLDAQGDPNAFFIIRGNLTLTVADAAQVVLANGAQACGVFWRFAKQVTIGKTVAFYGTVIAGTAITLKSGSALGGRALAQTAGVMLDANALTIPTDGVSCSHVQ